MSPVINVPVYKPGKPRRGGSAGRRWAFFFGGTRFELERAQTQGDLHPVFHRMGSRGRKEAEGGGGRVPGQSSPGESRPPPPSPSLPPKAREKAMRLHRVTRVFVCVFLIMFFFKNTQNLISFFLINGWKDTVCVICTSRVLSRVFCVRICIFFICYI